MSKEKVDAYREKKVNRKAVLEAERKKKARNRMISKVVGICAAAALVIALVISGITIVNNYKDSQPDYNRTSIVINDYTGASYRTDEPETASEETETEAETETETGAETSTDA